MLEWRIRGMNITHYCPAYARVAHTRDDHCTVCAHVCSVRAYAGYIRHRLCPRMLGSRIRGIYSTPFVPAYARVAHTWDISHTICALHMLESLIQFPICSSRSYAYGSQGGPRFALAPREIYLTSLSPCRRLGASFASRPCRRHGQKLV